MVELFLCQLAPSLRTFGTRLSHQGRDFQESKVCVSL